MGLWVKIRSLLSNRKFTIVLLFAVVIARILQLLYLFNTRSDMTYQILAAENFYHGHGISLASIPASDLASVKYEALVKWPPGFSFIFLVFYVLFFKNYIVAALALSVAAGLMLIFACRMILKILNIPLWLINSFTLISSFSIYYFYYKPCTDAVAISFFVLAIYFFLLLLKRGPEWSHITGLIICLFLCAFIKYLYLPVVFILPAFLIIKAVADRDGRMKKAAFISFAGLLIPTIALLVYQFHVSQTLGYITQQQRGFYPENLVALHPFLPSLFIKPESINEILPDKSGVHAAVLAFFKIVNAFILLGLITFGMGRIWKRGWKSLSPADSYFYITYFIILALDAILFFLSVRVAPEKMFGGYWTYVEEPRYYGLISVLLLMGIFILYHHYSKRRSSGLRVISLALILLTLPEMFRGLIFTADRLKNVNREVYGWQYELHFQKFTDAIVKKEMAKFPERKVLLTGSSDWMTLRSILYSGLPWFEDIEKINQLSSLHTTRPVELIVLLRKTDVGQFQPFLSSKNIQNIGTGFDFLYYSILFDPGLTDGKSISP